ncbi:LOW QUALITY PROTEIN: hypothetical protein CFC21_089604 [Triticum aestivum]|uniref:SHSP domain-containing protein n=2 Tax=Triticum aestivum TaxID=4565 RepID=A0A9R1IM98_WHEAT|nr:LOW QUALITY PROTEIN: hypothetical protein CFC21_089604 [Triticum aestivum]
MVELLFAPAEAGLVHLPEVLDHLAIGDAGHRDHARHHAMHGQGHGQYHTLGGRRGGGTPVDIMETPAVVAFVLDVPGLSKSDIQVTLEEDNVLLTKSANRRRRRQREAETGGGGGCRYIRLERRASPRSFVRKFRLPEDADAGAVVVRCENGVLTVTVKKQPPPEKKTKSVQVAIA